MPVVVRLKVDVLTIKVYVYVYALDFAVDEPVVSMSMSMIISDVAVITE